MEQFDLFREPAPVRGWWEDLPTAPASGLDGMRWYQREAYHAAFEGWKEHRALLQVLATGLGKTEIFSGIAADFPGNVLALAHVDILIDQGSSRLEQKTGERVEIEQADLKCGRGRVVMGSVPTLRQKHRLERLGRDRFDLIIIDEAHHATAKGYRTILDHFHNAKILGVTATPDRTDKKALGQVFDDVVYRMDIKPGIDAGYLVPFKGEVAVMEKLQLGEVDTSHGDFVAGQLDREVIKIVESVVDDVRKHHPGKTAIFFFPGVKSAEYANEKFNALEPGSSICITGKGPSSDRYVRKQMVREFKEGKRRYLCACMVPTEGFDAPNADLIGIVRVTKSRSLYTQMAGRGGRPDCDVDSIPGKEGAAERQALIAASRKPHCVLRNYVPVDENITLISPADLLGGDYTEAEIKVAKKKERANQGGDPMQFLDAARRELRAMAREMQAHVRSRTVAFDPFKSFSVYVPEATESRFGFAPATLNQKNALKKFGVGGDKLASMSKAQASKLLGVAVERTNKGLASFAQLKVLQQWGAFGAKTKFAEASKGIAYIKSTNWGKDAPVDGYKLQQIVEAK